MNFADLLKQQYGYDPLLYPKIEFVPAPKIHYEGGNTTKSVKYAIRAHDGLRGYGDMAQPSGFGFSLERAFLYDTAATAFAAILAHYDTTRELGVVPVTVTTTSERVKVVTTEIPAKTVYRVLNKATVPVMLGPNGIGFKWSDMDKPTEWTSANAAAEAIAAREKLYTPTHEWTIRPEVYPRNVKVERIVVASSSTSRSL